MSNIRYRHIGTPAEKMVEEIGEILQAIGKGSRFGWRNHHPDRPFQTNLDELCSEVDDFLEAFAEFKARLK